MVIAGKLDLLKEELTQVTAEFIDMVAARLLSLGYSIQGTDVWMIGFAIQKVVNTIQNECNVYSIPNGLIEAAIDRVCGEFLFAKKGSGNLCGFEMDLVTTAIKQVNEGDTSIVFALDGGSLTPEQRLDAVIRLLMTAGKSQFIKYRRLVW